MKMDFVVCTKMFLKRILLFVFALIPCFAFAQDVKTINDSEINKLTKQQLEEIRPNIEEESVYHQNNPKLILLDINTTNHEINKINSELESAESLTDKQNLQNKLKILDEQIKEYENKRKYIERYLELKNKDSAK